MPTTEPTASDDLEDYIPRPEKTGAGGRRMIAVDPDTYKRISDLAADHDTTRGRIMRAVTMYYLNEE